MGRICQFHDYCCVTRQIPTVCKRQPSRHIQGWQAAVFGQGSEKSPFGDIWTEMRSFMVNIHEAWAVKTNAIEILGKTRLLQISYL